MKIDQQLKLPSGTPAADEAIRRDWAEANISGGGGGFTTGRNGSGLYIDDTPGAATAGRNSSGLFVSV